MGLGLEQCTLGIKEFQIIRLALFVSFFGRLKNSLGIDQHCVFEYGNIRLGGVQSLSGLGQLRFDLSQGQWLSLPMIVAGVWMWLWASRASGRTQ